MLLARGRRLVTQMGGSNPLFVIMHLCEHLCLAGRPALCVVIYRLYKIQRLSCEVGRDGLS